MNEYEKLVKEVIGREFLSLVPCDELDYYELSSGMEHMLEDVYREYLERDDCATIFDIKKIFKDRGWL